MNRRTVTFVEEKHGNVPQRLSQAEEEGRIDGGKILVEATVVGERKDSGNNSPNGSESQVERVKSFAKESGVWTDAFTPQVGSEKVQEKTVESEVWINEDDTVTKVNSGVHYRNPLDFFRCWYPFLTWCSCCW